MKRSPANNSAVAPFFELRHASVWRGGRKVLRDASVSFTFGRSAVVLGPNGAGKSTFLKLLTGELRCEARPESSCQLFGERFWSLIELRKKIGVVMPEDIVHMQKWEPVRDLVAASLRGAFGIQATMKFSGTEMNAVAAALESVGISHLADREFGSMSSGEMRRTLIARALVHNPRVLVLDEPSTALDFPARLLLRELLRRQIRNGRTVLMVTHDPGEILPEIQDVTLIQNGRISASGPKHEILTDAHLAELFSLPLEVQWRNGWCEVTHRHQD